MRETFKSGEIYGHIGMRSSKIPKQIQPKELFTEIHYSEALKNQGHKENLESSKTRKIITYEGILIWLSTNLSAEILQRLGLGFQERMRLYTQNAQGKKKKNYHHEYFTQKSYHVEMKKR